MSDQMARRSSAPETEEDNVGSPIQPQPIRGCDGQAGKSAHPDDQNQEKNQRQKQCEGP